ncbi:hypothetical protein F4777DRAFT_570102 [Nemania sp. FL0916]|nr:hypothetical protein F4777DRAFT_570102 [Nemania sp. FL0916]
MYVFMFIMMMIVVVRVVMNMVFGCEKRLHDWHVWNVILEFSMDWCFGVLLLLILRS